MGQKERLSWLLDDLTERVDHVRHALVLSNDGWWRARAADCAGRTPSTSPPSRRACTAWPRDPGATSARARSARR